MSGILKSIGEGECVIEVQGIGYEIYVPFSTRNSLPLKGEEVKLFTHMNIKENIVELYGFKTTGERSLFRTLTNVSGIGPKGAIKILSSISVEEFKKAVVQEDMRVLTGVSGVGKRTASRIILELKEKLGEEYLTTDESTTIKKLDGIENDAIAAMCALGYSRYEAEKALSRTITELGSVETMDTSELVGNMLKRSLNN